MADAYNVDPFEPFEVEGFLISGVLYFIAPTPPPPTLEECCRATVRVRARADEKEIRFVPVFTDLDLAERFLDSRPHRGAGFNAIRPRTRAELVNVVVILARQGESLLGVDPDGPTLPRLLPIAGFLAALGITPP